MPEVFTYSSNIGAARMAMMVGVEGHKAFLRKMGQLTRMRTELPEARRSAGAAAIGAKLNTMTIAFGQGLECRAAAGDDGGRRARQWRHLIKPTFLKRSVDGCEKNAPRVVKPETSESMRYLMRLNAEIGSAKKAKSRAISSAARPARPTRSSMAITRTTRCSRPSWRSCRADKPKYLFLTLMDEPQGLPETAGYRTAAWNAGVVTGKMIERVGPLLGIPPRFELPTQPFPLLAKLGYGMANIPQTGGREH